MKRVLIIDDALIAQVILKRILTTAGYEIAGVVADGEQAYEEFSAVKPDVVLLDLSIPGKDGMCVLKEIKTASPATPVVMCSAVRLDAKMDEAMRLGANGYVVKPIDSGDLLSALETACH